jgi:PEGA domain
MGTALAGCSSFSMPDWLAFKPGPQVLQFASEPPGADVRTAQGQTCRTPCSLALPLEPQSITFEMNGYLPQTVPVDAHQSPPEFSPNPVEVALQVTPPPPPVVKPKPHRPRTHTAAKTKPAQPAAPPPAAAPQQSPELSPFPPPPPTTTLTR